MNPLIIELLRRLNVIVGITTDFEEARNEEDHRERYAHMFEMSDHCIFSLDDNLATVKVESWEAFIKWIEDNATQWFVPIAVPTKLAEEVETTLRLREAA